MPNVRASEGRHRKGAAPVTAFRGAAAALALLSALSCARHGKTLHVVWSTDILSLDPNARFEFATDMYSMNVFEPLLRLDRQMSYAPALATRWDIPDGKTWRFHLRPRVRFHDGSPFTADDVVFTLERLLASKGSDLAPYFTAVSSVRKVDNETVEIISDRPAGILSMLTFVYILPKDAVKKTGEAEFFKKPIGTGPYRFVEWTPGKSLTMTANHDHWAGAPTFDDVAFLLVTDREKVWDIAKANAPAILMSPSSKSFQEWKGDASFRLLARPGMTVQYVVCNILPHGKNPLADVRVRKALRAAIDYQELIRRLNPGQAFPASQYVTPDVFGYDPGLKVPAYEPGAAQKLLSEAGYPNGVDLTMNYSQGSSNLPDEVVRQLARSGIRVKASAVVDRDFYDKMGRCDGDLHLTGWVCSSGDASELLEGNFYGATPGKGPGGPQGCGYARPELDKLIDRVAKTLDPEERRNLLQSAMRMVMDDLPWIPLTISYDRYAITGNLAFEPRADGEVYVPDVKAR
jgi:peptide/nickel transport system substrate-binding protein